MGNYTIFLNVRKILDLKSSSEQIFSENIDIGGPRFVRL